MIEATIEGRNRSDLELLRECGVLVRAVDVSLDKVAGLVPPLGLTPLATREWYRSLCDKLIPQLGDDPYLVVAVVGGTNIGKSVIFNHIAGSRASATSPLASGTRHPVCLVPAGFEEQHELSKIFPGFELDAWSSGEEALVDTPEDRLYWRSVDDAPSNLLVLDTPDIDSDARVNWRRADAVRRVADVLIAVLTQQKYNDAAVKQYFRKAAAEDKVVLVLFNQCQLPEDEAYWPLWLETFCRETGVKPHAVYIAPSDRRHAEQGTLSFFERTPGTQGDGRVASPRALAGELSELRFSEIKLRTLTGTLRRLLDEASGLPAFLREVEGRSAAYESAAKWLSSESVIKVRDWPGVSNSVLVGEVRGWWRSRQHGLARSVHDFYDAVGRGMLKPWFLLRDQIRGPQPTPVDAYRREEWGAVLRVVEDVMDKLQWLSDSANPLLKPYLERMLAGRSRAVLLEQLRAAHDQVDFSIELEAVVDAEMRAFEQGSPELYRFYRQVGNVAAAARPLTSVVLFTIGWGPAGHLLSPMLAPLVSVGTHVVPIVADFAGGAAAAVAGDTALAGSANFLEARFRKLQTAFTKRRVEWLLGQLKSRLFGTVPEELQAVATIPATAAFQELSAGTARLARKVAAIESRTQSPSS